MDMEDELCSSVVVKLPRETFIELFREAKQKISESGYLGDMWDYLDRCCREAYVDSDNRRFPILSCSCGARIIRVAYSPYYHGLMFGCEKAPYGCFSQDEGSFHTYQDAGVTLAWYVEQYRLEECFPGSLGNHAPEPHEAWI